MGTAMQHVAGGRHTDVELITDAMLEHARTERNVLALMSICYELEHKDEDAKKAFGQLLSLSERTMDDIFSGKRAVRATEFLKLNPGLFLRWVEIHTIKIGDAGDTTINATGRAAGQRNIG